MDEILEEFAKANEDEQSAIAKYSKLMGIVKSNAVFIPAEVLPIIIAKIEEYIAEEMKHSAGLSEIYSKISGINPGG